MSDSSDVEVEDQEHQNESESELESQHDTENEHEVPVFDTNSRFVFTIVSKPESLFEDILAQPFDTTCKNNNYIVWKTIKK